MKKIFDIAVSFAFCAIIVLVPLFTKIEPPSTYSIFENRNLESPPVFSREELLNGKYLPKWDKYFSDHIWKRNTILTMYIQLNMAINRPVINNIVMADDALLPFVRYSYGTSDYKINAENMANKLAVLKDTVKEYGGTFIYIGVPEQMSMLRNFYPDYMNNNDANVTKIENDFFAGLAENDIDFINMRTVFLQEDDYTKYYSRTDHHYNLLGAFLTYQELMRKISDTSDMSLPLIQEEDINFVSIVNRFYGSRSRRLYSLDNFDEKLLYFTLKNPTAFTRTDNGKETESIVFHLPADEVTPVTYSVYMGGDIGETIIQTNRKELPNALIFGDSFTNPLETLLYHSFNETVSIDLRHYSEKTILEYIDDNKPDYVFCLRDDTAYLKTEGNGKID